MRKSELRRNMKVRNMRSGNIGEVTDPERASSYFVEVRYRTASGKGRMVKTHWSLENVEVARK